MSRDPRHRPTRVAKMCPFTLPTTAPTIRPKGRPPTDRTVHLECLRAHVIHGLTVPEIADRIGKSVSTVTVYIRRARGYKEASAIYLLAPASA